MPPVLRLTLSIAALVASQSLGAIDAPAPDRVAGSLDRATALGASQAVVGNAVEDFTFLDREGRPVRLSQYRGKPLLVSFIYTGCFQVCPAATRSLQTAIEAGRKAFGTTQFNIASIGFNPPADSPESLKAFARQHGIDAPNWEFLSPHASTVTRLARAFGFTYVQTPAGFDHVLQATLLDAEGRIYRQIYGAELDADAIGEPLRQLLRNAPAPPQFKLEEVIDRVRLLCTYYDPATGRYRVRYGLLIEVAGGVTFALAMLWLLVAEWRLRRQARRAAHRGDPGATVRPL